jgi:hypothetical protein
MNAIEQGVISAKKLPRQESQAICECAGQHDSAFKQGGTTVPSEVGLVLCAKDTLISDWYRKTVESHGRRLRKEGWSATEVHWHALCAAEAFYETYMDSMLQGATTRQQFVNDTLMCYDREHLYQRYHR